MPNGNVTHRSVTGKPKSKNGPEALSTVTTTLRHYGAAFWAVRMRSARLFLLLPCVAYGSTLKGRQLSCSSEMSGDFRWTACRYIQTYTILYDLFLFNTTANGPLSGSSGTTIRHKEKNKHIAQNNTLRSNRTLHTKLHKQ
jgi:hypothetical protein